MTNTQDPGRGFADLAICLTAAGPGKWAVELTDCPLRMLAGPMGTVRSAVTRDHLARLRDPHGWPNIGDLKAIGTAVWQSVMTPNLSAAFRACLAQSPKMRIVISLLAEGDSGLGGAGIRLQELPIEALYAERHGFLATNPDTPISRSLNFRLDRDPYPISGPLRILAVAAAPKDKLKADIQAEKQVLNQAVDGLTGVQVDWCDPPTRAELEARLQRGGYHILHFIGHGGFGIVDPDPTPRPHLCLENPANHYTAPLDADTIQVLTQGSSVRLVVMTACSSAAPTPDEEPYHARAFDGVAQGLLRDSSVVSAVVAMQFDMEAEAAVIFSKTFYTRLLAPDQVEGRVDQVVTQCRKALIAAMDAGHHAWLTPVLYSRCTDGRVFELGKPAKVAQPAGGSIHVDPANPPIAAIRGLLNAAFTPKTLLRFCQERDNFRPVLDSVGPNAGVADMTDEVISLCRTDLLWDDLLAEVAKIKPKQYAQFEAQLRG